ERAEPRDAAAERAALIAAADATTLEQQLDAADLLPYRASFEDFAPAYLAWLARRDREGWRWAEGEVERALEAPALLPQRLAGRAAEFERLRAGAGLAALGEGRVCDYCEARGLCRRDHWSAP